MSRQTDENWEKMLGALIRLQRTEQGLSQAELAERMNALGFSVRQTTIAKIEAGTRPLRVSEFVGAANALGLPWQALLGGLHIVDESDPIADLERTLESQRALEEDLLLEVVRASSKAAEAYAQARAHREFVEAELRRRATERY